MLTLKRLKKPAILDDLTQRWEVLPMRDRWALILLAIFLFVVIGGYGGYSMRQAAKAQALEYQEKVSDYFWLRGQAANIDVKNSKSNVPAANADDSIRQMLQQSGAMDTQVLSTGNGLQIAFVHPNQAVASKIVAQLSQMGLVVERLDMQQNQDNKSLQVKATLQN